MELSTQQQLFIAAYSSGKYTVTAAAAEAGINRGTAYNWLSNAQFAAELKARQNEVEDRFYNRATSSLDTIWDRYEKILDRVQNDSIELKALGGMFNIWIAMRASNKHEDMLRRIEKKLGIGGKVG